ncbi:MAG: hypothetical protein QM696_09875 [Steroidobacteraceae bacterium]
MSWIQAGQIFAGIVWRDLFDSRAAPLELQRHVDAALGWLCRAQDKCGDGVSYGYSLRGGWKPPYRETTGYIVGTLLEAAQQLRRADLDERALRAAHWLVSIQNPDGSISNPSYGAGGIVFDTGQVLFGLVDAYQRSSDQVFLRAAIDAGRWLVDVADESGRWTRNEHFGTPHVYNARSAWALLRLNGVAPDAAFERIARRNLDWAVESQHSGGLFRDAAFRRGDNPYTHNISYTICGLQESGWILGDSTYVEAGRRAADAVLKLQGEDGFVPGQITVEGGPAARYACLTGSCQLSTVWARIFEATGDSVYRDAARRALRYVMSTQMTAEQAPEQVRGAIAGSFPIWGRYAPLSYPNWATKFFVDAALLQRAWET